MSISFAILDRGLIILCEHSSDLRVSILYLFCNLICSQGHIKHQCLCILFMYTN